MATSRLGELPVALERGIEHVAEPVNDHGVRDLAQDPPVDART
mgnify:CR=1 FL=1